MRATRQKLVTLVPLHYALTVSSALHNWNNLFTSICLCIQKLAWDFFASAVGDISTTWSEEHFEICLHLQTKTKQVFHCNLCIMPWPIWAIQCTTCSVFVITFIEDGKCTPNCYAIRSLLACQFEVLYTTCYCCEGEVYGKWASDSLSLHLTMEKASPDRLCLQRL